jgi:PLP dependent protein
MPPYIGELGQRQPPLRRFCSLDAGEAMRAIGGMTNSASDPLGAVQRLTALRAQIAQCALDFGRAPEEVTLVAVSKTFGADEVWPTIATGGQTVFGENRVQEAQAKWRDLRGRAAELGRTVELHLIGPLQSNKAREAVETFDVIETVDREKIAAALAEAMARTGRRPRLFVEINTGAEPQKAGVLPADADRFLDLCQTAHGLQIEGLMCIPPAGELASPHFALLGEIARRNGVRGLSMGMSADWPLAVQLGATHIRVGSAIFGSRIPH